MKAAALALCLGLGSGAFSGRAEAQTTTCHQTIFGMPQFGMTCDTEAADQPTDCSGNKLRRLLNGCSSGDVKRANQENEEQKLLGQLIAEGRCAEAMAIPLKAGDLDTAQQVKGLCVPK